MTVSRVPFALRFAIGLLLVLALSLTVFYLVMHPPMSDLSLMTLFLGGTAAVSEAAGYAAYRLGWLERTPSLRLALVGGYALASLLTFFNVWVTARLMFTSQHDLLLATVLLLFAGGIAMLLGYFLSSGIARRIADLQRAAGSLAGGDLSARATVKGRDEVAALASSFNDMAKQLQAADVRQRELDALRRELWPGLPTTCRHRSRLSVSSWKL
jgi:HAMP domain-containing protein